MKEHDASGESLDLLRRLASNDERLLRTVLRLVPAHDLDHEFALDRRTRMLVRLGALLAIDAATSSLRWAVELASTSGAGDDAMAAVLLSAGGTAGSAQLVASASRLVEALDLDP
ncbi:MAG TPA: hypothetical protein VME22_15230 [Solirubrobacteraceae bacterium]|nr:hypothetical protein [Solirubrobacteraceae bacterium]